MPELVEGKLVAPMADAVDSDEQKAQVAFVLVRKGSFEEATQLTTACPQLWKEADADGYTLLHWGALAGNVPFITEALAEGAEADVAAANLQTPFMWAVIKGSVAAARILLDAGANPHAKDSMGATPFILSVQHQQHSCMMMMISLTSAKEMLEVKDNNGCGPIHWAAYKGDLSSLKLLNYFDANFGDLDEMRMTPLHRAVQASQPAVCEFLLEKEVDPSQTDNQGRTCMDLAVANQDVVMRRTLDRLLEAAGSVGSVTMRGDPAIIEAPPVGTSLRRKPQGKDDAKKMKEMLVANAAATFWLVCVSLATFQYLIDLHPVSWTVAPRTALLFELGVPTSLALFALVALSDPGKAPARVKTQSGVEDLMRACKAGENPDFNRLCTTTWVLKGLRTKYCTHTGACVDEFDHFCGWLNVAIGRGNHRPFMILACIEALTQICHIRLCWVCARHLSKEESTYDWAWAVAMQYPMLFFIGVVHSLTSPGIVMLALNHLRLIAINLTTNEMINASRYTHFWQEVKLPTGQKRTTFRNPFNKGSTLKNCIDFWWKRQRGQSVPSHTAVACARECCH